MSTPHASCEAGQSLVEVVAMAPIVLLCGILGLQALAAGTTYVYADNAAHAAALAAELGEDPRSAAVAALPGWAKGRVTFKSGPHSVGVTLRPRAIVPQVSSLLTAHASAAFTDSAGQSNVK